MESPLSVHTYHSIWTLMEEMCSLKSLSLFYLCVQVSMSFVYDNIRTKSYNDNKVSPLYVKRASWNCRIECVSPRSFSNVYLSFFHCNLLLWPLKCWFRSYPIVARRSHCIVQCLIIDHLSFIQIVTIASCGDWRSPSIWWRWGRLRRRILFGLSIHATTNSVFFVLVVACAN